MDALVLAAVLVVLILLLGLVAAFVVARWVWRPLVAKRVIVQLDNDHAVSGVLVQRRGPLLTLADVAVHSPGDPAVKGDGQAVVERSRVLWIQVM